MTNAVDSGFDAGVVTDGVGHASHMTAITPRGIVAPAQVAARAETSQDDAAPSNRGVSAEAGARVGRGSRHD